MKAKSIRDYRRVSLRILQVRLFQTDRGTQLVISRIGERHHGVQPVVSAEQEDLYKSALGGCILRVRSTHKQLRHEQTDGHCSGAGLYELSSGSRHLLAPQIRLASGNIRIRVTRLRTFRSIIAAFGLNFAGTPSLVWRNSIMAERISGSTAIGPRTRRKLSTVTSGRLLTYRASWSTVRIVSTRPGVNAMRLLPM